MKRRSKSQLEAMVRIELWKYVALNVLRFGMIFVGAYLLTGFLMGSRPEAQGRIRTLAAAWAVGSAVV